MKSKIGVVGMGFVGKAIYSAFSLDDYNVYGYDIDPKRSVNSFGDTVACDFVFICLPTPMSDDGSCDLSYVNNFFEDFFQRESEYEYNKNTVFVLKSTVPVGTTSRIYRKWMRGNYSIVHSPEFLSARSALNDFLTSQRHIIGDPCAWNNDYVNSTRVIELYKNRFPGSKIISTGSEESEFIKYFCNCFYSAKISFFNEMRIFSDKKELNWPVILEGVLSSGWVNPMHTNVPGHDGKMGFGGACFTKDINAMINFFEDEGVDPIMLKAAWERNKKVRKEK